MASDPERLGYYEASAATSAPTRAAVLVLNPGGVPAPRLLRPRRRLVTFEGPFADYARALEEMPAWLRGCRRGASRISYTARRPEAAACPHDAQAGYLYMTSGSPPNPWQALSPYLDDQEKQLARCPGA